MKRMRLAILMGLVAIGSEYAAFHREGSFFPVASAAERGASLADEGPAPGYHGATGWLNSAALDKKSVHGKVVLVNFWTYSCINSLRELPYLKAWAAKYKDDGLVVIGVHTPEFSFERETPNVEQATSGLQVRYPVAIDSRYGVWQAFHNEYWPANYIIDGKGRVRYHYFGEGAYADTERVIQTLLKENGAAGLDSRGVRISGEGIEAPPGEDIRSPETYAGYRRTERFASPERLSEDSRRTYRPPVKPGLNQWGLSGSWSVGPEHAALQTVPGTVVFRFHSRDLHMVLAPGKDGAPVRFRVRVDGAAPGTDHGIDSTPDGAGTVREPRLYQLVRQKGHIEDRTFEIEFLDPGARVYSFTFG